jgi:hypothetical protein
MLKRAHSLPSPSYITPSFLHLPKNNTTMQSDIPTKNASQWSCKWVCGKKTDNGLRLSFWLEFHEFDSLSSQFLLLCILPPRKHYHQHRLFLTREFSTNTDSFSLANSLPTQILSHSQILFVTDILIHIDAFTLWLFHTLILDYLGRPRPFKSHILLFGRACSLRLVRIQLG